MTSLFFLSGALLSTAAFVGGYAARAYASRAGAGGAGQSALDLEADSNSESNFSRTLGDGKYVGLGELYRFADLRGRIGFAAADELMASFAASIAQALPGCTTGRVGRRSVEFVFSASDDADAEAKLNALSHHLENTLEIGGCQIALVARFGAIASAAGEHRASNLLLHEAEAAMHQAASRNERCYIGLDAANDPNGNRLSIGLGELPRAIAMGQLELYYQPKLHCRADRINCAEALLRWHHPVHGRISTADLIELAEATGAIHDLSKWVINTAVADQARLESLGLEVSIDVNLSGALLGNDKFTSWALERLTSTARPLGVEVTETAVIEYPERAVANLRLLADAGVRIAIDDYGSGLSSLNYLKQLPAHELKIDRNFICGLSESHRDPLIIRSTIDLAHALEMEVTAEGVDDPMAFALLRAMGCDIIQGFLIAEPMPMEELIVFLNSWAGSAQHQPMPMLLTRANT